jgi:heme-degrading monooxygenase HmoA
METFPASLAGESAWAVIFVSQRNDADATGYAAMAEEMEALARTMPGFLGVDSVRDSDGRGITVSYWREPTDIARWRDHLRHREAQRMGRAGWYDRFTLHTARIESSREFQGD